MGMGQGEGGGGELTEMACLMSRGMEYGLRGPYMRLGPVIVLCS